MSNEKRSILTKKRKKLQKILTSSTVSICHLFATPTKPILAYHLTTGRQLPPLSSVLYGIISKRRSVLWPHNDSLEINQVPRELTLIAISLACLVAQ
jgi:hypothetical protein